MKIYRIHVSSTLSGLEDQVNNNLKNKEVIGSPFIHNGDYHQAVIEDVSSPTKPLDSNHITFHAL